MFVLRSVAAQKGRNDVGHVDAQQSEDVLWLKRQALQIVMQLPDDRQDALRVLDFAKELVLTYLGDEPEADKGGAEIVQLVAR